MQGDLHHESLAEARPDATFELFVLAPACLAYPVFRLVYKFRDIGMSLQRSGGHCSNTLQAATMRARSFNACSRPECIGEQGMYGGRGKLGISGHWASTAVLEALLKICSRGLQETSRSAASQSQELEAIIMLRRGPV